MSYYRASPSALSAVVYLAALVVPVLIGVSVVGSSPYLLDRVVPEEHRETVAAFGTDLPGLSGAGYGSTRHRLPGAPVVHGEWSKRRMDEHNPPAGLRDGIDFAVHTTKDGLIAHWACRHEITVFSFDAPPGIESDIAWAVDTLAFSSGLELRYAGPGSGQDRDREGTISVTVGHHPDFDNTDYAGVGGPSALWPDGRISKGRVVLRPGAFNPVPGDPWTRTLVLHELMHALGVEHAAEYHSGEIMAERPGQNPPTILGYGDQYALHLVGCP